MQILFRYLCTLLTFAPFIKAEQFDLLNRLKFPIEYAGGSRGEPLVEMYQAGRLNFIEIPPEYHNAAAVSNNLFPQILIREKGKPDIAFLYEFRAKPGKKIFVRMIDSGKGPVLEPQTFVYNSLGKDDIVLLRPVGSGKAPIKTAAPKERITATKGSVETVQAQTVQPNTGRPAPLRAKTGIAATKESAQTTQARTIQPDTTRPAPLRAKTGIGATKGSAETVQGQTVRGTSLQPEAQTATIIQKDTPNKPTSSESLLEAIKKGKQLKKVEPSIESKKFKHEYQDIIEQEVQKRQKLIDANRPAPAEVIRPESEWE